MDLHSASSKGHVYTNRPEVAARSLGILLTVFLLCLPLFSQTSQGTIQGAVFDQTGGAIAGATVTVTDVARGVSRALTADGAGAYVANNLTPGTYTVRAEAKGFRTVEHSGVLVEVGQTVRVDLVVQPGEQTQTITVTGEVPAIDTTDATLGRNGQQPVDQRAALEWPQLRALAATASGRGYFGGSAAQARRVPTAARSDKTCCEWKALPESPTAAGLKPFEYLLRGRRYELAGAH